MLYECCFEVETIPLLRKNSKQSLDYEKHGLAAQLCKSRTAQSKNNRH